MNIKNLLRVGAVFLGLGPVGCGAAGDGNVDGPTTEGSPAAEAAAPVEQLAEVQYASSEAEVQALREANLAADRVGLILGPSSELLAEVREQDASTYFIGGDYGIVVHAIGKIGTQKLLKSLPRGLSAVEIFRRIAPEQTIPTALIATQQRVNEALRNRPARDPVEDLTPIAIVEGSPDEALTDAISSRAGELRQAAVDDSECPAEEFASFSCNNTSADIEVCRLRKTGTNAIREDDVDRAWAFACPYRGKITHILKARPWSTWNTIDESTLLTGWNDWMIADDTMFVDQDIESRVENANGDGFHHAASFWD